jgi:drug/metabolite transporter (DMT)-like permease
VQAVRAPGAAALFAIATAIWGSTWLAIKFQLGVVAPEASVVYRFAAAGSILAAFCIATGRPLRFPLREHGFLALQGTLLFGLNYVAVYLAEQYVASGLVAVLFSTIVLMNPIGMRVVFGGPRLTAPILLAAALGVAGVALLFLPDLVAATRGGDAALGVAYGLGATLLASGGNLAAIRNQKAGIPIVQGNAWGMLYGALAAGIVAVAQGVAFAFDPRPAYLLSLAYLVLAGSIAAFGAYLSLLKKVGAGRAAFVGVATPIVALALSTMFEGYRWSGVALAGVALAVIGNLLALRPVGSPARR